MIDPTLLQFATPRQKLIVEAAIREGSVAKAAREAGISRSSAQMLIKRLKQSAAKRGYSPEHGMTKVLPDTQYLKGTSVLYDGDGKELLRWVKSNADQDRLIELAEEIQASFFAPLEKLPPVEAPETTTDEVLTAYIVADLHLGMYAAREETGDENYDCDVAEGLLNAAADRLIDRSPASDQCIIAQLGDWIHCQDNSNATKRSGNVLDIDTRWYRVARMALRVYRRLIDRALTKHKSVHVVNVQGNHDGETAYMIGLAVETAYENEPRVTVDNGPGRYHFYRFGNSLIGMTHGDTCKPDKLGDVMMDARRSDVGEVENCYWWTGHVHHISRKEFGWYTQESFRTLAAKDAYHASAGYRAGRDMNAIIIDKNYGEWDRNRVSVAQLHNEGKK